MNKDLFSLREEEIFNTRMMKLLSYVKREGIKKYVISGLNQNKEWKILIKIGK
jgi:ribosomal protein S15P/S13E